jgi:xanthine dehydrogenase small subunit
LIALGAQLHLCAGNVTRELPLEHFFLAYGKQDRKPGELVWQIDVPKLRRDESFVAYKISKRFDQDISAVMFALKASRRGQRLSEVRLAMGGMAATPKRAALTEAALGNVDLNNRSTWQAAIDCLNEDFKPITDMRASAAYRMETAQALLQKALIEMSGQGGATRVMTSEEAVA